MIKQEINKENIIDKLEKCLSKLIPVNEVAMALVRMIFIKYAIDNCLGDKSISDNQQLYQRAQKMLAMKDAINGVFIVQEILNNIDEYYLLNGVLSNDGFSFNQIMFGQSIQKVKSNIREESFKEILEIIGCVDLEENKEHTVGKMFSEDLIKRLYDSSEKRSKYGTSLTKKSISKISKELLQVKNEEKFYDFVSGMGLSTIEINKDINSQILCIDKNHNNVAIAAMLFILCGFTNFKIICEDSMGYFSNLNKGDKIFVDPPVGLKIECNDGYRDVSVVALEILKNSINQEGIGVMTIPSGPLFQSKGKAADLRKQLLAEGAVKAVIALPPLWAGAQIGTNLIVLQKGKPQFEILFIDAIQDAECSNKRIKNNDISDELITRIVNTYNDNVSIDGFSKVISHSEIINNDNNFLPATYVMKVVEEENLTLDEIDQQLKELYSKLGIK